MGGGGAMRAAAKVAGIGVANTAVRGGLSAVAPPSAEQSVRSASRPVSAIISQSGKVGAGGVEVAQVQRPAWELDEWEFAGGEEEMLLDSQEPLPRVVFGGAPSLEEAKTATAELKDALEKVCQPSPTYKGSLEINKLAGLPLVTKTDSLETKSCITCDPKAPVEPVYAMKAFTLLNESPAAQTVVASLAADPKVWNAVLQNDALKDFLDSQKTNKEFQELGSPRKVTELSDTASQCSFSELAEDASQAGNFETKHVDILEQIKVSVVEMVSNVSHFVQNIFGFSSAEKAAADAHESAKSTFFEKTAGASFMALALMVIMVVVLKRV